MKKLLLFLLPLCLITVSFFYVKASSYDNKGRKYYEEAGQILWEIQTEEKIIALTFDDGPHRTYTSDVLDVLDKYQAKATFFIVGQNAEKILSLFRECTMKGMNWPTIRIPIL